MDFGHHKDFGDLYDYQLRNIKDIVFCGVILN